MKYFHHDTDTRRNRKIRRLLKAHGMIGYGIWWALIEELSLLDGEGFQIHADEMWLEDFAEDLRLTDHRILIRVFDTLAELRLIDPQLWAEHVILSPAVIERGDGYVRKKAENAERKRKQREKEREKWEAQKAELERLLAEQPHHVTRDTSATFELSRGVTPSETEAETEAETETDKDLKGDEPSPRAQTSSRKKVLSEPKLHKEEFNQWWKGWYKFCKEVLDRPEDRQAGAKAWDKVIARYTGTEEYPESIDVVKDIFEGSDYYYLEKRRRSGTGQEGLAIPNECRFLNGKTDRPTPYWKTAIDYKRSKELDPSAAPTSPPPASTLPDWLTSPDDRFLEWLAKTYLPQKPGYTHLAGANTAIAQAEAWLVKAKHDGGRHFDEAAIAWNAFNKHLEQQRRVEETKRQLAPQQVFIETKLTAEERQAKARAILNGGNHVS